MPQSDQVTITSSSHGQVLNLPWIAYTAIRQHQALQNQGEFSALLALAAAAIPQRVVEIGGWAGGTAWAFAQLPSVEKIITVDLELRPEGLSMLQSLRPRAEFVHGDSTHDITRKTVVELLDGGTADLVLVDGGHDYATARADFAFATAITADRGLIVMHDTQGYPGNDLVQVPRLWAEIREEYQTTEFVDVPGGPGGTGIIWV